MEAIFLKILNMSITASWLVLAIVILRLILKKAPKAISVFMSKPSRSLIGSAEIPIPGRKMNRSIKNGQ